MRGSLCAYEIGGDYGTPVWSRRIETEDILPELRQKRSFVGSDFTIGRGKIADVFPDPDHPGEELVVTFHNEFSQRAICIYDLDGDLLYQVWHDGTMDHGYWMSDARLLVYAADNAMLHWDRRGNLVQDKRNPLVVFALRPKPGCINDSNFLNDPDFLALEPSDGPSRRVWYKCLYLGEAPATRQVVNGWQLVPSHGENAGRFVRIDARIDTELEAGVGWTLDEFGNEVPGSRRVSDGYQVDQASANPTLPDPFAFKLGPLPPIVATSQPAEAPPGGGNDGP